MIIRFNEVDKSYELSSTIKISVLRELSMTLLQGDFLVLLGPSGCGKTTILRLLAGLSPVTRGEILISNFKISDMDQDALVSLRSAYIGLIFQDYQLIQTLTCLENVMLPAELADVPTKEAYHIARQELVNVGLESRLNHYPMQLSGGEQQRATWARAFVHQPSILLADEPTSNLDTNTRQFIYTKLKETREDPSITTICSSHDKEIQKLATCKLQFNEETQRFDFFRIYDPPEIIEDNKDDVDDVEKVVT